MARVYHLGSPDMQSWILRSINHVPFVGLHGGWGPQMMNSNQSIMDTQKKKKKTCKEFDNELPEVESTGLFARFLIIESLKPEKPLSKLSPFVIEKVFVSVAGSPKSVKKLRNRTLLAEVEKAQHSNKRAMMALYLSTG